jgi:hypothetical protein
MKKICALRIKIKVYLSIVFLLCSFLVLLLITGCPPVIPPSSTPEWILEGTPAPTPDLIP